MRFSTGTIRPQKSRKLWKCRHCSEEIEIGTIYALRIGISGGHTIYTRYHSQCWFALEYKVFEDFAEYHQKVANHTPGMRTTRLSGLTPEQRKRRQTLQGYITKRDIPALKKAYEQKSTERVIKVMSTFASRWREFATMGVNPKKYLWKDKMLDRYIAQYDRKWLDNVFLEDLTLEQQAEALSRTMEDEFLPNWGTK